MFIFRFGLPYEAERYEAAIQAACLDSDFCLLPGGDMTELGETKLVLLSRSHFHQNQCHRHTALIA